MSVTETIYADAVALDDQLFELGAYPIVQNVTPFPEKLTFGDYTRANDPLASDWILSTWEGGFLKRRLKADVDIDRFWDSTVDTRYTTELLLPPLATPTKTWLGYPANADATSPSRCYATSGVEFVDTTLTTRPTRLLVAFYDTGAAGAFSLRKLDFAAQQWVSPDTTSLTFPHAEATYTPGAWATSAPLDCVVPVFIDNQLFFVWGSAAGLLFYSPTDGNSPGTWTWQTGNSTTGNPCPAADRLVAWDNKLFACDSRNGGFWLCPSITAHIASPAAWTRRANLPFRAYDLRHLTVFRNVAGEPVIHAVGRQELWAYDFAADQWVGPVLKYPRQGDSGDGLAEWKNTLYLSSGTAVLGYDAGSIRDIGMDREWGLPVTRRGPVYRLAPAESWLAAGLDSNNSSGPQSQGGVYLWNGVGWHHLWLSAFTGINVTWLQHAYADASARIWWGSHGPLENDVYYVDLPTGIFNPREVTTTRYAPSGQLVTGWQAANWEEQQKVLVALAWRAEQCTATETITVEYALDDDETAAAWQPIGTITTAGEGQFALGPAGLGVPFRTIRLRLTLVRGADPTKSPVLRFLGLKFARRPQPLHSYALTILVRSPGYNGKTPEELEAALEALLTKTTMTTLAFRRQGAPVGRVPGVGVFCTHWGATVFSGTEPGGRYTLDLVEYI